MALARQPQRPTCPRRDARRRQPRRQIHHPPLDTHATGRLARRVEDGHALPVLGRILAGGDGVHAGLRTVVHQRLLRVAAGRGAELGVPDRGPAGRRHHGLHRRDGLRARLRAADGRGREREPRGLFRVGARARAGGGEDTVTAERGGVLSPSYESEEFCGGGGKGGEGGRGGGGELGVVGGGGGSWAGGQGGAGGCAGGEVVAVVSVAARVDDALPAGHWVSGLLGTDVWGVGVLDQWLYGAAGGQQQVVTGAAGWDILDAASRRGDGLCGLGVGCRAVIKTYQIYFTANGNAQHALHARNAKAVVHPRPQCFRLAYRVLEFDRRHRLYGTCPEQHFQRFSTDL